MRHIVWRLGQLDLAGEFGWHKLEPEHVAQLERELMEFESRPLYELTGKLNWLKPIPAKDMTPRAQRQLVADGRDPDEDLWQLHLSYGKWRIYGYYSEPYFHISWWDPDHDACTGKSVKRRSG